jgi:ketosteroid isomerase-like protein
LGGGCHVVTAADDAAVAAVVSANAAFYAAFENGDLDAMGSLWVGDDPVCVHPGWQPVRGPGPLRRSWAVVMANTPYIQFILTDVEVRVFDSVASVSCTENVLAAGGATPALGFVGGKAVATNVFRRTDQGWLLWIHHASPVLSPEARSEDAG